MQRSVNKLILLIDQNKLKGSFMSLSTTSHCKLLPRSKEKLRFSIIILHIISECLTKARKRRD